jgi:two-component system KDP operon response regulator KdpE
VAAPRPRDQAASCHDRAWEADYARATGNLRLDMTQLRHKLEPDPARPRWLLTEPGMGYRFQPGPPDE